MFTSKSTDCNNIYLTTPIPCFWWFYFSYNDEFVSWLQTWRKCQKDLYVLNELQSNGHMRKSIHRFRNSQLTHFLFCDTSLFTILSLIIEKKNSWRHLNINIRIKKKKVQNMQYKCKHSCSEWENWEQAMAICIIRNKIVMKEALTFSNWNIHSLNNTFCK